MDETRRRAFRRPNESGAPGAPLRTQIVRKIKPLSMGLFSLPFAMRPASAV